ncbi:MAG TPA: class I adenylate-forming enzyme family protein [Allosphingosinicella sp.]|nr:class I adenylate-forming enzyme family protein [Allosphingosinicella sp.]
MRLADRIASILALDPAAPAIEYEGAWRSWGQLREAMASLEAALGDHRRVGILMRNHVAIVPAILEAIGHGRCLVVLNPMLPADRLAADLAQTGVGALIGVAEDLDRLDAGDRLVAETGDAVQVRRRGSGPGAPGRPEVAVEMLTSGTTGPPKRIPMRRSTLEEAIFAAARFEKGRGEGDAPRLRKGVQLVMAPFSHIGGLFALLNAIAAGRSMVLLPKFTVEGFRDAVKRHGIKAASTPPAALRMIYDADVPKADLASLMAFRSGTAPLDPALAQAVYDRYGIPVLQNYGATEFGGGVAGWTLDDFRAHWPAKSGSVGRLNPGVEGRIVEGVLELKSRQIGDGETWLATTDLARIDEDGFLFILGRADNAIIRGGFKIQPDDIVRALEAHPAVKEAAVTALADARLGQVPGAAYLLRAGAAAPSEAEFAAFLKHRLTGYQIPAVLKAVETLPRTVSMKVDQSALRALLEG